ncbi:hypothetical protein, partial [Vibrio parahaemolyticus]|uniref:hypothetical protein n=1 Tax=Vibrio parahaemolyticus TaxID=670 RepID=UPI0038920A0D
MHDLIPWWSNVSTSEPDGSMDSVRSTAVSFKNTSDVLADISKSRAADDGYDTMAFGVVFPSILHDWSPLYSVMLARRPGIG